MKLWSQTVSAHGQIGTLVYSKVGALHVLKFMRASLGFFSHGAAITCGGLDPNDQRLDTCEEFDPKNNR